MYRKAKEGGSTLENDGMTPYMITYLTDGLLQIDCSHGNSLKQHGRQVLVAEDIVSGLSSNFPSTCRS